MKELIKPNLEAQNEEVTFYDECACYSGGSKTCPNGGNYSTETEEDIIF